jgi:SAM-dependent methyltransferase
MSVSREKQMSPRRTLTEEKSQLTTEVLLKQRAATYDALAPEYHTARFEYPAGRYDFEETSALMSDIVPALLAGRSLDWRALDVACGTGKIAVAMAQAGGTITALDAAEGMLQQCAARARNKGVLDNVILVHASADKLPFPDDSFDIVFSFRFLHLFPLESYQSLVREMARVVKPGGYLVVEMKNRWYGGVLNQLRNLGCAIRGRDTSSLYSIRQLPALAYEIGGVELHLATGLLLPKGWRLRGHRRLAHLARKLARGPLKSVSGYLVAVYRKE